MHCRTFSKETDGQPERRMSDGGVSTRRSRRVAVDRWNCRPASILIVSDPAGRLGITQVTDWDSKCSGDRKGNER